MAGHDTNWHKMTRYDKMQHVEFDFLVAEHKVRIYSKYNKHKTHSANNSRIGQIIDSHYSTTDQFMI